jgi:hypothetical protein
MRKFLAALLVLSGCSSGTQAGPPTHADFIPHSNVIQVVVNDPRPVRSVQLVAPSGLATPATSINTDRAVYPGSPGASLGFGVGGFSGGHGSGFGSGAGFGLPLGGGQPATAQSIATATIPLADPADYRQNWQSYHIEIQLGDPPSLLTLGAPPPPA